MTHNHNDKENNGLILHKEHTLAEQEEIAKVSTYLLTWNPRRYEWEDFDENFKEFKTKGYLDYTWSCGGTKRIKKCDRLFLIRQVMGPRGIFASGWATSEVYPGEHWDDNGKIANYVDLRFDVLLDPLTDKIITREELDKGKLKKGNWSTRASGITIPPDVAIALERKWNEVLNMPYFDSEKNIMLYGPPGTGKTYNTINYAVAIIERKDIAMIEHESYDCVFSRYLKYKEERRVLFTTFHQSYGYEEFIEGIKPQVNDKEDADNKDITYRIVPGIFKAFCERAMQTKEKADYVTNNDNQTLEDISIKEEAGNYVFIIDEINRGNIAKIFGELITLIENERRIGEKEAITATLPYSGDDFGVPNNVYIVGTMNTADRSIAFIDTALRRRFKFIEMMPNTKILENIVIEEINIKTMLEKINQRIELLFDREHMIGHAYFTCLIKDPTLEKLATVFRNAIIPLLQEYFYEDYGKIQLVLGDNDKKEPRFKFIIDEKVNLKEIFKDNPDIDIPEKIYFIQEEAFSNAESYIEIYEKQE
jgi:hypothetical protein